METAQFLSDLIQRTIKKTELQPHSFQIIQQAALFQFSAYLRKVLGSNHCTRRLQRVYRSADQLDVLGRQSSVNI